MRLFSWLKAKLTPSNGQAGAPARGEELERRRKELAEFLVSLSRRAGLDANTRKYLTQFMLQATREIDDGTSVLYGPDAGLGELAGEGAIQGFLDPQKEGTAKGVALREDVLMRIIIHYAEQGSQRCQSIVRNYSDGTLRKRSTAIGSEEATRAAREFVSSHSGTKA
jgi:hypothetical protein